MLKHSYILVALLYLFYPSLAHYILLHISRPLCCTNKSNSLNCYILRVPWISNRLEKDISSCMTQRSIQLSKKTSKHIRIVWLIYWCVMPFSSLLCYFVVVIFIDGWSRSIWRSLRKPLTFGLITYNPSQLRLETSASFPCGTRTHNLSVDRL